MAGTSPANDEVIASVWTTTGISPTILSLRCTEHRGGPVVKFSNSEDVERWLRHTPREVAIVIAARAALRVVPSLALALRQRRGGARTIGTDVILPVLRATAAPWVAARYPTRVVATRAAADIVATRADAADAAADAAAAAAAAADDADAAVASYAARTAGAAAAFTAVSVDANAIDGGKSAAALAGEKLWLDRRPEWARENWAALKKALTGLDEGWEVWLDWYEARRDGEAAYEALEVARVLIPEEIWRQGPKVVNAEIRRLIVEHADSTGVAIAPQLGWHFFLSYSSADEPSAHWIAALLEAAGFHVFAQFDDIPAGSNFVREMQRGLTGSSRFIALQSPDYVKSDHCQAEWSAAYASDPGGAARKLVPFLVQPTELPPLARQIVYTPLIGLSAAEAATAVLKTVGYAGPLPDIPPGWPGGGAIEKIQAATGGIYNVAPSAHGLLERQPSAISQEGEGGFTPEQLFADLAREIGELAEYTKRGKGNFAYIDRLRDRAQRLDRTASAGFSNCDALALNKQLVWMLRTISLDQNDGLIPTNDEVELYAADLFGYYNRLEHIFPQLKTYRRMDARQRFTSPEPEVEQAIDVIYSSLGNPEIAGGALSSGLSAELREAGEDIAKAKMVGEGKPPEETLDVTVESHANAATRSLAVWNWLTNASEKFAKSGKNVEEVRKTIENYEKLYGKLSPQMQTYLGYLLKWFF